MIDEERRQQFLAEGAHFESEYFLSLTYLPPAESEERAKGWLFDGASQTRPAAEKALDHFRSRVAAFSDIFESLLSNRNHVGMLSEDLAPASGELWGNFPQTYSMVGVINGAIRLSRRWESVL